MLFKTEIFNTAQSISIDSTNLYHGSKSNILQRLEKSPAPGVPSPSSAIIIELSPILRCDFSANTIDDFAQTIYIHIMNIADGYDRVDIVCDHYFDNSLKSQTRIERGQGSVLIFDEHTKFLSDFKDNFLKNNNNKVWLNHFLADKFSEIHHGVMKLTVTKGSDILTNDETLCVCLLTSKLPHQSWYKIEV